MDDPILIAKLAARCSTPSFFTEVRLGELSKILGEQAPTGEDGMIQFLIKAEAALRVMLAKEILNAAHK